jgi:hypothetical protein
MTAALQERDTPRATPPVGRTRRRAMAQIERHAVTATLVFPVPLLVYLGVNAGGYSRGIVGVAAAISAAMLALRAVLAPRTVRRPGTIGMIGALALFGLAAWQLLSAGWSDSPTRAIQEFDRTVLYLVVFLAFATLPRRSLQSVILAVGAAIAVLAIMGLAARLRPDLFPTTPQPASPQRLAFPLTYWNAMGVMLACGLVIALHLASEVSGSRWIRMAGAAICPALAVTLYLTLSRGGLGAAVLAVAVYAAVGRPRGLVPALIAIVPTTVFAVLQAYGATELVSSTPTSQEAVIEGRDLTTAVVVASLAALVLRAALFKLDDRLAALRLPRLPDRSRPYAWPAVIVAALVVGVAAGVPHVLGQQYDNFVRNSPTTTIKDPRSRLTQVYNAGRLSHWDVALNASRGHRLGGLGAGTFDQQWYRYRHTPAQVTEAHSLYVETLSELGVVGLALLAVFLASMVAAAVMRRARRPAAAAVAAVVVGWALHAGLDWDWEMPAVTLIPIILAAAAAAAPAKASQGRRRWTPLIVAVGALVLAVLPTLDALSDTRIDQAEHAYANDDCATAHKRAEQARSLLPMRPEPHAIIAVCALRTNKPAVAKASSARAVASDPNDWEWRFLDALVIGTAGADPRPELAAARARNPRGVAPQALSSVYRETPRALWPLRSVQAYVWIHGQAFPAIRR